MSSGRALLIGSGVVTAILASVFAVEGGYVNDPADPGGETNHGITIKVAREAGYTGSMRDLRQTCVGPEEICASSILIEKYIVRPGFMPVIALDRAVGEEIVDTATNMGPVRPSKFFQRALNSVSGAGLAVDGHVGPATVAAFQRWQTRTGHVVACNMMLDRLDGQQAAEYRRLIRRNPRLSKFRRGWFRLRIGNVDRRLCLKGAA